jgi:hypothetical protein
MTELSKLQLVSMRSSIFRRNENKGNEPPEPEPQDDPLSSGKKATTDWAKLNLDLTLSRARLRRLHQAHIYNAEWINTLQEPPKGPGNSNSADELLASFQSHQEVIRKEVVEKAIPNHVRLIGQAQALIHDRDGLDPNNLAHSTKLEEIRSVLAKSTVPEFRWGAL